MTTRTAGRKQTPAVTIRMLELDDLPAVYRLGLSLFTSDMWPNLYRTWDEYELVDLFSSDSDTCFVAEADERIVGFILGTVIEKPRSAWNYGYVVWIGVDPAVARRNVGSRLLDKLTSVFIEQGVRLLMVDTDADNTAAIEFFTQKGFGNPNQHVYLTKNVATRPARAKEGAGGSGSGSRRTRSRPTPRTAMPRTRGRRRKRTSGSPK